MPMAKLLVLLFLAFWLARAEKNGGDASVVIVGAGLAGIMAAKTLQEHGVRDFVILEATNAVGGRMREEVFAGKKVEIGATWVVAVNETTTNPIWKMAQQHKLQTTKSDFYNISIYTKRGLVEPPAMEKLFGWLADQEKFFEKLGQQKNGVPNNSDMSVFAAQRLYGKIPLTPEEMALDYFSYDYEYADPTNVISFKHTHPNPIYRDYGTGLQLVHDQRGFSHLAWKLSEEFLSSKNGKITDPRLKLNTIVKSIEYSSDGVTVRTENGKMYRSKYAIVTVSLGVLQSELIKFTPALPAWKVEAINKFDMGLFTKIFLKFPHKFWPEGELTEFFLYADSRKGYYPVWQQMEREFPGENIMLVTVTDMESRRIERQPLLETKKEIMRVLKSMFGSQVPEPMEMLVPKWGRNRFFVGTNTNWPVDVEDYEFKRIGTHLGNLYFAGEHTNPLYRALQGAYYSGITVASEVLKCMSSSCKMADPHPSHSADTTLHGRVSMNNELSDELSELWKNPKSLP